MDARIADIIFAVAVCSGCDRVMSGLGVDDRTIRIMIDTQYSINRGVIELPGLLTAAACLKILKHCRF